VSVSNSGSDQNALDVFLSLIQEFWIRFQLRPENKIKHKNYNKTLYIQYELGLTNANKGVLNQTIQDLSDVNKEDIDTVFEALAWYKFNALKYRILSKMAWDILAVPITIVASESSFSVGGRVINPHQVTLSTKTLELILCGHDWARALHELRKNSVIDEDEAISETFMHIFIMC
jgi:hypothetical protein